MDISQHIINFFIFFFMGSSMQRIISVKAEVLKITGECVEYLDLKDKKNLTQLEIIGTSMRYFPELDCNNTTPGEEQRALNLPKLIHL